MGFSLRVLTFTLATAVLASSGASAAPKPTTILFVGNSFTHGAFEPVLTYNRDNVVDENADAPLSDPRHEKQPGPWGGIPGIFARFCAELRLPYDVHEEAISGIDLGFHADVAMPIIAQAKWDTVVLQGLSTEPVADKHGGHRNDFQRDANILEAAIHAKNPNAQIFLYETFPRADITYPLDKNFSGENIGVMARELHDGYQAEYIRNGHFAGLAPTGDAWMRAINSGIAEANPYAPEAGKLDLWNIDHYHPSNAGAYLNACVLFYRITGVDPRKLGANEGAAIDLGLRASAVTLQKLAHDQIVEADAVR